LKPFWAFNGLVGPIRVFIKSWFIKLANCSLKFEAKSSSNVLSKKISFQARTPRPPRLRSLRRRSPHRTRRRTPAKRRPHPPAAGRPPGPCKRPAWPRRRWSRARTAPGSRRCAHRCNSAGPRPFGRQGSRNIPGRLFPGGIGECVRSPCRPTPCTT